MPLPGAQYTIDATLVGADGLFTLPPWQKRSAVDNVGNVYVLSFDMKSLGAGIYGTVMELYKFNGSSYSEITAAQLTLSDWPLGEDNICARCTGSMVMNDTRTKLCITYTTQTGTSSSFTWSLKYREFDIVALTWGAIITLYTSSGLTLADTAQIINPDIVVSGSNVYVTFFLGYSAYLICIEDYQIGSVQEIATYISGTNYHCTIDKGIDGWCYIATYNEVTDVASLYRFLVLAPILSAAIITVAIENPIIVIDDIGDIHFFGKHPTLAQGRYAVYDVSAASLSSYTALVGTGDFDSLQGYGIVFTRETDSAISLYAFYGGTDDKIYYKKYGGTWGSATVLTTAFTAIVNMNIHRDVLPSTVQKDFVMCVVQDNDGATPYPLSAWHSYSGSIIPSVPTTGGYYDKGNIRHSTIYGINTETYAWNKIIQFPERIIAINTGVETTDLAQYQLDNDANDAITFSTGTDLKEYDNISFDDLDNKITCILTKENIDIGVSNLGCIDAVAIDFIGGDFEFIITNENGVSRKLDILRSESGVKRKLNFFGTLFKITITESSTEDFKVQEIRLYPSTTETNL